MSRPRIDEHELDRLWNDLAGRTSPSAPYDLPRAESDAVRLFHGLATTPPSSAARERVGRELLTAMDRLAREQAAESPLTLVPRGPLAAPPRHHPGNIEARPKRSRGKVPSAWSIAIVAAFVLLIGITGGWTVLGDRLTRVGNEHDAVIPAPVVTPEAAPDPANYVGVLIDTILDDQTLVSQYVTVQTLTFGTGAGFLSNSNLSNNVVSLVTDGQVTYTITGGPAQVFRGLGGVAQVVTDGSPQLLNAGDAIAWGPQTHFAIDHEGGGPASIASFIVSDPVAFTFDLKQSNASVSQIAYGNATFSPGPVRLVARRISLEPGATYQAPSGAFTIAGPEHPTSEFLPSDGTAVTNTSDAPAAVLVMTLEPAGDKAAATATN